MVPLSPHPAATAAQRRPTQVRAEQEEREALATLSLQVHRVFLLDAQETHLRGSPEVTGVKRGLEVAGGSPAASAEHRLLAL